MTAYVLDNAALHALAVEHRRGRSADAFRARRLLGLLAEGDELLVPTTVLVGLYRGTADDAAIDAALSRHDIYVVELHHPLARVAGRLRARQRLGRGHVTDATVAALAVEFGSDAAVVTGDPDDLRRLLSPPPKNC